MSDLAQLYVLLEPLLETLGVLLGHVVLGVQVMSGGQNKRGVAVGGRLGTCPLQGSVQRQPNIAVPPGEKKLLLLQWNRV